MCTCWLSLSSHDVQFSELQGRDLSQLVTCVPACLGAFSTDFETRVPGSLPASAVYTAQLHL